VALELIAAPARRHAISPSVTTAARARQYVIVGELVITELARAIEALIIIALEQRAVGQWRFGALAGELVAAAGENGGQLDDSSLAGALGSTAMNLEDGIAECPQHEFARV